MITGVKSSTSWAAFLLLAICVFFLVNPAAAQQPNREPAPRSGTPAIDPVDQVIPTADEDTQSLFPHFKSSRVWLTGQANFIFQTHPEFPALYSGKNSLGSHYDKALSRVVTLYSGVRVNNSLEFLADIEEAGGSALSTGLGLAGDTNLDIVRNPLLSKAPYLARGMIHKVIALSDAKVENERNALSLFEELPRRRLEFRFGKFSMPDFFDINSVGSDTKFQFANWTIDNNGAWDYAADTRGYTVGLMADFEDRNWGLRFAEALMPKVANGIDLVWKPWQARGENFEYELRHGVLRKKSGVVRLLGYTNAANMGIYRDQIIKAAEQHTIPSITDHPWHITRKYGFGVNIEQTLTQYLSAFARFGWDDGRTESFAYTEVDQTFAEGIGAHGSWWHRRQDRAGIAFVSNAIKKDHQNYLAAGGLGFLLGDGHLRYGRENILESYYTLHVWRGIYVAPGAQHINNPGYNQDRGPVLVPSFRLHVEF
jgi:hypothetical protein